MLKYELATILSLTVIFSHFKYIEKPLLKLQLYMSSFAISQKITPQSSFFFNFKV